MNSAEWQQVSTLFADCLQRSAEGRELLLAGFESSQPDVVREVRELLATYDNDRQFLESPAIDQLTDAAETRARPATIERPKPGVRAIGAWLKTRPAPFKAMLAAEIAAVVFYVVVIVLLFRFVGLTANLGWDSEWVGHEWRVNTVEVPGAAAGILEIGDVVRALNDSPAEGTGLMKSLHALRAGERYSLSISRRGSPREFVLVKQIVRSNSQITGSVVQLIVSLAFFIAALVIGALKPAERITQLAWAALLTEALTLLGEVITPYSQFLRGGANFFYETLELVDGPHFALAYHFYTRLFARDPRKRHTSIFLFYGVGLAIPIVRLTCYLIHDPWFFTSVIEFESAYYVVAPLAICVAVLRNYMTVSEPDAHRRLRWVVFGSLGGIVPYIVIRSVGVVLPLTDAGTVAWKAYELAFTLAILPAILIPFATGYAILKHRLFDIDVVLRRGAQYLLAKNMLRLVLALPILGLAYALLTNARRPMADVILHNGFFIVLVLLVGVVLRYRERVGHWLDRKFFRESYRQERMLISLIENVKKLNSVQEMCCQAGTEVMAALHPESVSVFYHSWSARAFLNGFSADGRTNELRVPVRAPLAGMLQRCDRPEDVTSLRDSFGEDQACRWLDRLGVDLVVPIAQADRTLAGFMLLGRKKSEEPYSPADRALLATLAEQMAIVCENLSLQERLFEQQKTTRQMRVQAVDAGLAWLQECPACGRCFDLPEHHCPSDGSELISALPIRRVIDGRYRLDRVLGKGGMGVVYQAWDLRLHRNVAVKLVLPGQFADAATLKRFSREARALARLSHPNIVATHDFGVIEEEVAFIVMEFVAGTTLRSEMRRGGIGAGAVADWMGQMLEGVNTAHESGIVHRDLKPENILISYPIQNRRHVKIADFGIAKWTSQDTADSTLTVAGTLLGSIQYMSPEQLNGQEVDSRSDIFSAGLILFEVLVGRPPFGGRTAAERIVSILNEERPFESALPGASDLHRVLEKCLARDPARRYDTAAALKKDLIPALAASSL